MAGCSEADAIAVSQAEAPKGSIGPFVVLLGVIGGGIYAYRHYKGKKGGK